MKSTWIIAVIFCSSILTAQDLLLEDFSEGALSTGSIWEGDLDHFIINSQEQLQLSSPSSGSSIIYTKYSVLDTMQWRWEAQLLFSPSNKNRLQIYFLLDTPLVEVASGLMIQIGESGNNDALELYQLDKGKTQIVQRGLDGNVSAEDITHIMQICRNGTEWEISASYTGLTNFNTEMITSYTWEGRGYGYFILKCIYTETRSDKFLFDNIFAGPKPKDSTGPQLNDIQVLSDQELILTFSEDLDSVFVFDKMNYRVLPDDQFPSQVNWQIANPEMIKLFFAESFKPFEDYKLQINQLNDKNGNSTKNIIIPFKHLFFTEPKYGDIIFTEILADPTPTAGLPEIEYFELFNAGSDYFDLSELRLIADNKEFIFPNGWIEPGKFMIVCHNQNVPELISFGETIGLVSFPTLNNDGDRLELYYQQSRLIDKIHYTDSWYTDNHKKSGGFSLELINPHNKCSHSQENWGTSNSPLGGTPGQQNSIWDEFTEIRKPQIAAVKVVNHRILRVAFNQVLRLDAIQPGYSISPDISVDSIRIIPENPSEWEFYFNTAVKENQVYELRFKSGLTNCNNYSLLEDLTVHFGISQAPAPSDLIINEVLFNPRSGGSDYLEIYNRSQKIIDISDLILTRYQDDPKAYIPLEIPYLLLPSRYLCITPSIDGISKYYKIKNPAALIEHPIPVMPNQQGQMSILYNFGQNWVSIDQLNYHESYHSPFIVNPDGISLERINPDVVEPSPSNWQSAAESAGFGTPGYQNSQYLQNEPEQNKITFRKRVFSPNGDGVDDELYIQINTNQAGYILNGQIYDMSGRMIDILFNQEIIGTNGMITWDGYLSNGVKAKLGRYILLLELLHANGSSQRFKETIVIADFF